MKFRCCVLSALLWTSLSIPVVMWALLWTVLSIPTVANAQQLWTGLISPSRAINWSQAGAVPGSPGALPDANWTQCGTTLAAASYGGSSSSPASASAINSVISGCAAKTYVQLGTGTFYLTGAIAGKNQVAIRGLGANSTSLVMYSNGSGTCNGQYTAISLCGDGNYYMQPENSATWTGGFSQGATSITVSNSINIVANQTTVILDQQDLPTDPGNIWVCAEPAACGGDGSGGARTTGTCSSSVSPYTGFCTEQQIVLVTACSPSCNNSGSTVLTISPGLYASNWAPANSTGAWWATTTAYQQGVEDMSIDLSNLSASTSCVTAMNAYEPWISGIRCIQGGRSHISFWGVSHGSVLNNYFYQNLSHATQSYAVELFEATSDTLVLNNIFQQVTDSSPSNTSGAAGNVAAYNFAVEDLFASSGWFQPSDFEHSGGDFYWLREGNETLGLEADDIHGTHNFTTLFRNRYPGWQTYGCGGATSICPALGATGNSSAVLMQAASRYFNVIGNVIGQAGYHTNYTDLAPGNNQNSSPFYLGGIYSGNPGGNVSTSGTAVTWASGEQFPYPTTWASGQIFQINGNNYTISSVNSPTSLTLTASAGTQTNVSYLAPVFCGNAACTFFTTNYDTLTQTSIMRWGNWDDVTAGCGATVACSATTTRFCTSNATPIAACTGDERAGSFGDTTGTPSVYAGLSSPSTIFPNSFFLTGTTSSGCGTGLSWWKNPTTGTCPPFPAVGPDVSGGNMGICSGGAFANSYATAASQCSGGTLVAAFGGHANANPAMACYLNVMNGPPDGTGSVLTFNRASCYAQDSGSTVRPPTPPNLSASPLVVQ